MGSDAEIRNVKFNFFTATWVEMNGARGKLSNVLAPSLTSNEPAIIVAGANCVLEDIRVSANSGPSCIEVTGDRAVLRDILSTSSTDAAAVRFNGSDYSLLDGLDSDQDEHGLIILNSQRVTANNVRVTTSDDDGIILDGSDFCTVRGVVNAAGQHGVRLNNSDQNRIEVTVIDSGGDTTNTYDNLRIEGASNRNFVTGSIFRPRLTGNTTRAGVNVAGSGECNIIVGNDLGDPDPYGTDALVDTASNTQIFYPADATYGDNFTDCGSGS